LGITWWEECHLDYLHSIIKVDCPAKIWQLGNLYWNNYKTYTGWLKEKYKNSLEESIKLYTYIHIFSKSGGFLRKKLWGCKSW
jgi:hypothetical protein